MAVAKPTHASVTEQRCACDYLQNAADDPDSPIIFDQRTGEYQFTYQEPDCEGLSSLVIYHCPFCGGVAPESKRALLFAVISRDEERRLAALLRPIETIRDALEKLGTPDFDGFVVRRQPERDEKAPTREQHRMIRYEKMSDVADIWITEREDGRACLQLQGKYLGR
jgi:hypothetical protein